MSGVNNKKPYHTSEKGFTPLVGEQSVLVSIADKIRCQLSTKWVPNAKINGRLTTNKVRNVSYRPSRNRILDLQYRFLLAYRSMRSDIGGCMNVSPIPLRFPIPRFKTLQQTLQSTWFYSSTEFTQPNMA